MKIFILFLMGVDLFELAITLGILGLIFFLLTRFAFRRFAKNLTPRQTFLWSILAALILSPLSFAFLIWLLMVSNS